MGARDLTEKEPYGNRLRTLQRAPLWLSDVLPDEARRTWPIVLPVAAAGAAAVTAAVVTLIRGDSALPPVVGYLVDVPLDAKGRPPKLKKASVLLFARPVPGRDALR